MSALRGLKIPQMTPEEISKEAKRLEQRLKSPECSTSDLEAALALLRVTGFFARCAEEYGKRWKGTVHDVNTTIH